MTRPPLTNSLRAALIEAGARVGFGWTFDSLHPEDQESHRVNAAEQLDAFLDTLADRADEWVDGTGEAHPAVSTVRRIEAHRLIAVLRGDT